MVNKLLGCQEFQRSPDYYDMKFNGEYLYRNIPECKPGVYQALLFTKVKNYDPIKTWGNKYKVKFMTEEEN